MEYIVGLNVLIVVFMVGYFATSRKYRRLYFWSIFPCFCVCFYTQIINTPYRLMRILSDLGWL